MAWSSSTRRRAGAAPVTKLDAGRRLGSEARRGQAAQRHRALAARGGAGDQRPVGAHRALSGARAGRRADQGARRSASSPLDGVKWAKAAEGPTARPGADQGQPGARRRRRGLCRADQQGRQHLAAAPGAGNLRRDRGDGSVDRPRARDGRRLLLRPEPVQPRDPGDAPARLVVQAVRLCRRARQRLHALDRGDGRADRDRPGPGHAAVAAGKLFDRQVLRALDAALRHRACRATP